jgi:hypothetical protein
LRNPSAILGVSFEILRPVMRAAALLSIFDYATSKVLRQDRNWRNY